MTNKRPPAYYSLRIYLVALLLFLMLVFPISLIMLFKYGPYWIEERNLGDATPALSINAPDQLADTLAMANNSINWMSGDTLQKEASQDDTIKIQPNDLLFGSAVSLLLRMMLVSLVIGYAFNYPFKRYFRRKRKGKEISTKLLQFCQRWLLYVPVINSFIMGIGFVIALIFMGFLIFDGSIDSEVSKTFYSQFFFISLFASFLTVFFMYFWFRYRVRFRYLEHIYDSLSLFKTGKQKSKEHIIYRLWTNSAMTTLLPLVIVVFYLTLSTSSIQKTFKEELTKEKIDVLFGKYTQIIDRTDVLVESNLFYVNAIDSLLMFFGIYSGIIISIIYLFFFVNWTNKSIVLPIEEVLEKMQLTDKGELGQLAIVRTTDEMGALAVGYNEMASRITSNIKMLKETTEANQRFVPQEFLQMLEKASITDIQLGDQVQKFMTVLFVDIKSFTTLSEQMTPKENFDFLNNYLGFMEPVIRKHHGFIDKFIGDSIMALFGEEADDAVRSALEMQERLEDFNLMLAEQGKPPIEAGAGIHTGNLMLGVVGGEGRMESTVISDAVNLANRLEGLTRLYNEQLIISETTLHCLKSEHEFTFRFLDEVLVKGRKESVKIYSISKKEGMG